MVKYEKMIGILASMFGVGTKDYKLELDKYLRSYSSTGKGKNKGGQSTRVIPRTKGRRVRSLRTRSRRQKAKARARC